MLTVSVTITKACVDRDEAIAFANKVRKKLEDDPTVDVTALMTDTLEELS